VDSSTTRRFGGTGLGLAITHQLVQLMDGEISVESTEGSGTTVRVSVPVASALIPLGGHDTPRPLTAPLAPDGMLPPVDVGAHLRVLVAEDDVVNQKVTAHLLTRLGADAVVVASGADALAALDRDRYDLVLMDINMPGMDGVATLARIWERWGADERPWVVAMTANALPGDRERFLAAGMDDYLSKPVRLADLSGVLNTVPVLQH